jgi:hypothetical protein
MELVWPTPVPRKKPTGLTGAQKRKLCELYQRDPRMNTVDKLIDIAEKEFDKIPGRDSVQKMIRDRGRWLALNEKDASYFRQRAGKLGNLEEGLFEWLLQVCPVPLHPPLKCAVNPVN